MLVGGFDFFSISRLELTRNVLIRHITLACDESTNHRPNVSRIWVLRCRRQTPIESEKKVSIKEILSDCPAKDGLHCFNRIWDWWNHQLWHFYAFLGSETLLSWGSPVWILRVIPFCWLVLEICAKWTRFFFLRGHKSLRIAGIVVTGVLDPRKFQVSGGDRWPCAKAPPRAGCRVKSFVSTTGWGEVSSACRWEGEQVVCGCRGTWYKMMINQWI